MRVSRNSESGRRPLSTADLANAGRRSEIAPEEEDRALEEETVGKGSDERSPGLTPPAAEDRQPVISAGRQDEEALVALFTPERADTYRSDWNSIQSSFVDDPKRAVRSGDELVAQVMADLANSFADERHRMEAQLGETGEGSTENLRVALRRYRSFFERLLSL